LQYHPIWLVAPPQQFAASSIAYYARSAFGSRHFLNPREKNNKNITMMH